MCATTTRLIILTLITAATTSLNACAVELHTNLLIPDSEIFDDGFDRGDTSAWSSTVP